MQNLIKYWVTKFKVDFRKRYILMMLIVLGGYSFVFIDNYIYPNSTKTFCIVKNVTGYPCPGCGMTRSTILMFHGHFNEAILMNPIAYPFNLIIIIGLIWMSFDLINGKETFMPFFKSDMPLKFKIGILTIILINWFWSIYKGL